MPYKKALFIYSYDDRQYFAGWENGRLNHPLWSGEIDLAHVYTSQKQADDDYEILKRLGFDVEVRG